MATYKKRAGGAGIRGQLYETKLLSLIFFRAKHDETIEEFQLASSMDEIGMFDDICFKVKVKGIERPIAVFIQARHRDNGKVITYSQNDLIKCYNSYLKLRHSFNENRKPFNGNFDELDCLFVNYTNARDDIVKKTYEGNFADTLYHLIGTGDPGALQLYEHEDVELLCEIALKEELVSLAWQMAKFIGDRADREMSMVDVLIQRYHVVLAQKVFEVSEILPGGIRHAKFRQEFFDSNEELLTLFRDTLVTELQKRNIPDNKEELLSMIFKVPSGFGNKDLTVSGTGEKIERRLNFLTSRFIDLFDKSKPDNIVTIDETMESGFLQLNGGIAGAIGNLLVTDDNTNLLKFTDNFESLGELAQRLFTKLKDKVQNLNQYKFDVKVNTMPKLSFAYSAYEENLASDFLNKLLFYSNQADENQVEEILKSEIDRLNSNAAPNTQSTHAIFLNYHDKIQKWWMMPQEAVYLTKESNIYENSVAR